ncbi:MAG: tetratricopeptide repeat protein [Planctomycetota bacterium]
MTTGQNEHNQPRSLRMTARRARGPVAMLLAACVGFGVLAAGCSSSPRRPQLPDVGDLELAIDLADRADSALESGDIDRAERLYRQSIEASPRLPRAFNNYGLLLLDRGDYPEAQAAFARAVEVAPPESPDPLINLGLIYQKRGWGEESLKWFLAALDRDPNNVGALRGAIKSAYELNRAGRSDHDRVRHALLIENDPDWVAFYRRELFRISGRLEEEQDRGFDFPS